MVGACRKIRKDIDEQDALRAKREYSNRSPGFNEVFTYKKGVETKVMTESQAIARKYRGLRGKKRPWDE
jgi:hypothetical protein